MLISLFVLVVSDVVVLVYLYSQFIMARRALSGQQHIHLRGKDVRKRLLAVSIPTTGLRIFHAVVNAIEPFLVKGALLAAGVAGTAAIDQYGMLAGVAVTIGSFPAFIAHSLMVVMIPSISEAYALSQYDIVLKRLKQSIFITLGYGIPAVWVMFQFADLSRICFFTLLKRSITCSCCGLTFSFICLSCRCRRA